jgi:hypothetical protein
VIRVIVGVILLLLVFALLFSLPAMQLGWRVAAALWGCAIVLTGVIVLAVWLITGSLS